MRCPLTVAMTTGDPRSAAVLSVPGTCLIYRHSDQAGRLPGECAAPAIDHRRVSGSGPRSGEGRVTDTAQSRPTSADACRAGDTDTDPGLATGHVRRRP